MGRKRRRLGFTCPKQEVVMVQGAESSDVSTSTPKVSPDDHNYSTYRSQQVLSVLVRHTYNVSPEHEEGLYTCSYCRKQYSTKSWYIKHTTYLCEVKKKAEPQKLDSEEGAPPLPRLRARKQTDMKPEKGPVQSHSPQASEIEDSVSESESESESEGEGGDSDDEVIKAKGSKDKSSDSVPVRAKTEASDMWHNGDTSKDSKPNATPDNSKPDVASVDVFVGHFICSSCGKQYRYEPWYERHMRHCGQPKTKKIEDAPPLPRLRVWKKADVKPEEGPVQSHSPEVNKSEDNKSECSLTISSSAKAEASDSWHRGVTDNNIKPNASPGNSKPNVVSVDVVMGHFLCSSCGKRYRYKSCYEKHMGHCGQPQTKKPKMELKAPPLDGDASTGPSLEGSDPALPVQQWVKDSILTDQLVYSCSVPYCGQSFVDERALLDHQGEHSGLKDGGNEKGSVMSVCGEQPVCGTRCSQASAKSPEPSHTDCLSMIQISNVTSLVTSRDEFLRMTEEVAVSVGEGREPAGGDPPSVLGGKNGAACPGGRRVLCLLCGRWFRHNKSLDQHVASAHCERLRYPCASCNMSYKARISLCRHALQAHCDLKKLKCCVCKRRYRAARHLQGHVLKQHCGQKHLSNPPLSQGGSSYSTP